jgi:hypothetical protein
MGMQENMKLVTFVLANKIILLKLAGLVLLYAVIELWAWLSYGPRDTTNNGITVGDAKAFDNRSLTLRIERLSNQLAAFKVVNQSVTDNLSKAQKQTSTQTTREISANAKSIPAKTKEKDEDSTKGKGGESSPNAESKTSTESAESASKSSVELAASDVLSEQLNLASQILNLEMLYERSLTDRLFKSQTRLQTVLGFQVSITPPRGCENAVAVVEIGVRMKSDKAPVSLVALIPHEKTYNSQTFSTSAYSIGGSAVTNVLTLGVNKKGESRQLFIHRDSDTIAFERNPRSGPTLFDNDVSARVFGWEFRPVLGRSSVVPGIRQMLAVIALPIEDPAEKVDGEPKITLEIQTRSYWRHFNKRKQTTGGKWGFLPWQIDRSMRVDSRLVELEVPTTKQIQGALEPRIKDVTWVNSGGDRATVIVTGSNFFTGTRVVVGGVVHGEEDENHKLILKSNQALEFETSIASLGKGDCVLSGRFGPSCKLLSPLVAAKEKKIETLLITKATIRPNAFTDTVYLLVDIKALDKDGEDVDFEVEDIQKLPEPILFLGTESVPLPYDYFDVAGEPVETTPASASSPSVDQSIVDPSGEKKETQVVATAAKDAAMAVANLQPSLETPPVDRDNGKPALPSSRDDKEPEIIIEPDSKKNYVQVGAWVSKKLATSPSVTFRVPFCGLEYQASQPLIYSELTASRMGDEGDNCVFRIISPGGFKEPVRVELDTVYQDQPDKQDAPLKKMSMFDYRFKVPIRTAARYRNMLVRMGTDEPLLLPICVEDHPKLPTDIMVSGKPQQIKKDSATSIEWSGTALDAIDSVTLVTRTSPSDSKSTESMELRTKIDFAVYDDGNKVEVYLTERNTAATGKVCIEFLTKDKKKFVAPLFITAAATD